MEDLTFLGGFLLGLASSLHCAGMCGGIASGLMFAFDADVSRPSGARVLVQTQIGRILAYIVAGTFLGFVGSQFYGAFDQADAHNVMRWAAAVALGWIGLSTMGIAPPLSAFDRLIPSFFRFLGRPARLTAAGPFVSGIVWGFLPCGMVYGALFYAMLSGTGTGGAMVMAGFGLGTLPSVVTAAWGISLFRQLGAVPRTRIVAGLALVCVAVVSVAVPAASWELFCLT